MGIRFQIGEYSFLGDVLIDPVYDRLGVLLGKTLGSYVGASADAVKEPIFDLVNINLQTINPFFTLIRMGLPQELALKFLSAKIISEVVAEYSQQLLEGTSFNRVVQDKIN